MTRSPPLARFSRPVVAYGMAAAFVAVITVWLAYDFWKERERTIAEVARVAVHQSQLISSLFGDTFLATDYILRDIVGHAELALARKTSLVALAPLLEEKLLTVRGLTDLVLLDENCSFVAIGKFKQLAGTKSRQRFCAAPNHPPGQSLHIQYMPAEKSANGKPVVLMSRVIASPQGQMQAAAMAVMELNYAQHWIEDFAVEGHDVQTILDTDGIILARNPPLPDGLGKRIATPPGQPAFDQVSGTHSFTASSPLDKQERVFGLTRLERFPFITIVGYDKARALEGWQQRAWQFSFGFVVLVLLLFALIRAYLLSVRQGAAMYKLATTDALTGIANRRQLFELGERETRLALRYGKPLAVLMLDIDLFKKINDRWGHPSGDNVIRNTADLMRDMLRTVDICGRLGGEEFMAILPETDSQGAHTLAERLRLAIEASEAARADDGQAIRYTVSIGIAVLSPADTGFETILQRADSALYQAKEAGRNRVAGAA